MVYQFSIWIIAIGIYDLTTSQFGHAFILEHFFEKKIYYGNYENIINSIEFKLHSVESEKNLTTMEKEKKIQELKHVLKDVVSKKQDEEYFSKDEEMIQEI